MRRTLAALLCLSLAGCPEKMPLLEEEEEPHQLGNATVAETALIEAGCTRYDECAEEYGRLYDSFEACVLFQLEALDESLEAGGRHAADEDAEGCTTAVQGVACDRLHTLVDIWETDSTCRRVEEEWHAHQYEGNTGVGDACLPASSICQPGTHCALDLTGGPRCLRCETYAGLGDDCTTATCNTDLYCDTLEVPSICAALEGRPCPGVTECAINSSYICDAGGAGAAVCHLRTEDDPCDLSAGNRCTVNDPTLVCVQGLCAPRSNVEEPCDNALDCASFDLICDTGRCADGAGRGEDCLVDTDCKGFLVCKGTCTDLPGLGESCHGPCLLDLDCVNLTCRELPDEIPVVGIGDDCMAVCGAGCLLPVGTCEAGWCGSVGTNLPWTCERYLEINDPCEPSTQPAPYDETGCEPGVSHCFGAPAGVCTAYVALGADCTTGLCDPLMAYCAAGKPPLCTAFKVNSDPCTDPTLCLDGYCYGTCAGGTTVDVPCTITGDCGTGGICSGACSGPDPEWTGCAP